MRQFSKFPVYILLTMPFDNRLCYLIVVNVMSHRAWPITYFIVTRFIGWFIKRMIIWMLLNSTQHFFFLTEWYSTSLNIFSLIRYLFFQVKYSKSVKAMTIFLTYLFACKKIIKRNSLKALTVLLYSYSKVIFPVHLFISSASLLIYKHILL